MDCRSLRRSSSSLAALLIGALASSPLPAAALTAKVSASRGIPWTLGSAPRTVAASRSSLSSGLSSDRSLPLPQPSIVTPLFQDSSGMGALHVPVAAPLAGPGPLVSLKTLAVSAAGSARYFFDGGAGRFRPEDQGPVEEPKSPREFLDRQLFRVQAALDRKGLDLGEALQAVEVIFWSKEYLGTQENEDWMRGHGRKVAAMDRKLARQIVASIASHLAAGDVAAAREILEDLDLRHDTWAKRHAAELDRLRAELPSEDRRSEPVTPASETERLAEMLRRHLEMGEWRQVDYFLTILKTKPHARWAKAHAAELAQTHEAYKQAVYRAFEAKKERFSPVEARRLQEYAKALGEQRNLGFGFAQPQKQDPESLMCTILSICSALQATIGFADPAMDAGKFTELVRAILKDPDVGKTKGISTHRMRTLMRELGLPLKVIEMQERLRRPFEEEELRRLLRPDRVVIPVFVIVQSYDDGQGLRAEEHKGFLRDAFWSPTEKEWVYLMMDPLIGRTSFYTWSEMKTFLHKLFVIKVDKPLSAPKEG